MKNYDEKFAEFHAANPQVYAELVRLARVAVSRGRVRIGVRMLWEVTRWNLTIQTNDPNSNFKLNDHLHSRYARLIMKNEEDLKDVFELRELSTVEDSMAGALD